MRSIAISLILTMSAGSAISQDAQDAADWELTRNDRQRLTAAYLPTSSGLTILIRCQGRAFSAFIAGLPAQRGETREIGLAYGDDAIQGTWSWLASESGEAAFSSLPAPFARKLREGGRVQIRVVNGDAQGRTVRHVLDLPPSSAAIDQVLTACDRPLVDPRDAELDALGDDGLPSQVEWQTRPRISVPVMNYARAFATVSCIAADDGRARDCVIETEHPHDAGLGRAALRAMERARLTNRLNPDAPIPPSRFTFTARYILEGYQTDEDRARERESRDRRRQERGASN